MPAETQPPYAAFRLNLEQQKKRAKELIKAAKSADQDALHRLRRHCNDKFPALSADIPLALAQHCIARELRFDNWAGLKRHIGIMEKERSRLATQHVLDDDCPTMHIRCGHDILQSLQEAGLHGETNLQIDPLLEGPVADTPDWLRLRARFIVDSYKPYHSQPLDFDAVLAGCHEEEARLAGAARDFTRVVLWVEHDRLDQFVLIRVLAWFAEHGAPPQLELVSSNNFPGAVRFIGLGQLPPEALVMLWHQRQSLDSSHLRAGKSAWDAFRQPDPGVLVRLMKTGIPALPDLASALHRHLLELPSMHNGLGLTQQLLLQTLAETGSIRAGRLVGMLVYGRDPLPGLGDISHDRMLREFAALPQPLVQREGKHAMDQWHQDTLEITQAGRCMLAGELNWLSLPVAERWVGGVCIRPGQDNWHWNEERREALLLPNH